MHECKCNKCGTDGEFATIELTKDNINLYANIIRLAEEKIREKILIYKGNLNDSEEELRSAEYNISKFNTHEDWLFFANIYGKNETDVKERRKYYMGKIYGLKAKKQAAEENIAICEKCLCEIYRVLELIENHRNLPW